MLPQVNRLTKDAEFARVMQLGERQKVGPILIVKLPSNSLRFGFVVSKKVSKLAVGRNRFKRIMRDEVRLKLKEIKGSFDVVVMLLYACEEHELRAALNQLLR